MAYARCPASAARPSFFSSAISAPEVREMFQCFEAHTYFGPSAQARIDEANALVPGGFTDFPDWARKNMKAPA